MNAPSLSSPSALQYFEESRKVLMEQQENGGGAQQPAAGAAGLAQPKTPGVPVAAR